MSIAPVDKTQLPESDAQECLASFPGSVLSREVEIPTIPARSVSYLGYAFHSLAAGFASCFLSFLGRITVLRHKTLHDSFHGCAKCGH